MESNRNNNLEIAVDELDLPLLLKLPPEVILLIILMLPRHRLQLASIALTCHTLFTVVNKRLLLKQFPKRYDYSQIGSTSTIQPGVIFASALSPGGTMIAFYVAKYSRHGRKHKADKIRFYDTETQKLLGYIRTPIKPTSLKLNFYKKICFSFDGKNILAMSSKKIDVYELASSKVLASFDHVCDNFSQVGIASISEKEFIVGGIFPCYAVIYNIDNKSTKLFVPVELDLRRRIYPKVMRLSPDKSFLLIVIPPLDDPFNLQENAMILLYDVVNHRFTQKYLIGERYITDAYLSKNNKNVYFKETSNNVNYINIFSIDNGEFETVYSSEFDFSFKLSANCLFVCHPTQPLFEGRLIVIDLETKNQQFTLWNTRDDKFYIASHGQIAIGIQESSPFVDDYAFVQQFKQVQLRHDDKLKDDGSKKLST